MMKFKELSKVVNFKASRDFAFPDLYQQMFWYTVSENDLKFQLTVSRRVANPFECLTTFLAKNPSVKLEYKSLGEDSGGSCDALLISEDNTFAMKMESSAFSTTLVICAQSEEVIEVLRKDLNSFFPEKRKEDRSQVLPISFWYYSGGRPTYVSRDITVPNWTDVKQNYPDSVVPQIEELIDLNRPIGESKLIIMNGTPGCGKTFLLRTLLWEWRSWAKADFVLDPEVLFSNPGYLLSLILDSEDDDEGIDVPDEIMDMLANEGFVPIETDSNPEESAEAKKKWRIIVLEDADNFISTTAKTEYGQAVGRMLNLLDGLVGQGLNLLVIITANEEDSKIHEAVKRPGRCLSNLAFKGFSETEAIQWLNEKGLDKSYLPTKSVKSGVGFNKVSDTMYTLAEMYQAYKQAKKSATKEANADKEASNLKLDESDAPEFITNN